MAEDSHRLGGRRTQTRHNVENMGISGLLFVVLNRIDSLDSMEKTAIMGAGVVMIGAAAKFWSERDIGGKLLAKVGLGSLVLLVLTGCGISLGQVKPEQFEGSNGETIIACEMRGIQIGVGDGGVCQNAEGGHVSSIFSQMFIGTVEAAGRVLGALLSPFGAIGAAGEALRAPAPPPAIVAPEEPPGDPAPFFQ